MRATHADVLSILEAAYVESDSVDGWIDSVLAALEPQFDLGHGVIATLYEHRKTGLRVHPLRAVGEDMANLPILDRAIAAGLESASPEWARRMFPRAPMLVRSTELLPLDTWPEVTRTSITGRIAIPDALGLVAGDPSGHGCIFWTRDMDRAPLSARMRAVWSRVASHLVNGHRLARRERAGPEAVLDPSGRVLHRERQVTAESAGALADATRRIDRARGRLRRVDPDRALQLWQGLVAGRWSLVDQFDHDGRRFVVAKRNALPQRPWKALSEREAQVTAFLGEGQSLKIIAYQMGVSIATVAADVQRVRRKLGLRSRLEVVAAYRARESQGRGA